MSEVWIQGNSDEDKVVYDESESVEAHLLQRNCEHLQQANNTPFANGNKSIYLGNHGISDFTDRVLNKQPFPELNDVDPVIRTYIE